MTKCFKVVELIWVPLVSILICSLVLLACAGNPQDDWIGTWQDVNDPELTVVFTEDGIMLMEYSEGGFKGSFEVARYTVDKNSYTITALNNDFTREAGIAGEIDTGEWTLSDGRLRLYPDDGDSGLNLRRV